MRLRPLAVTSAALVAALPLLASAQGRLRPPGFVTCERNQLTSFTGEVVSLVRKADRTMLRMKTDEQTTERFTLRHPGQDASGWFYRAGVPFTQADWHALLPSGRLHPAARATVWVCAGEANPKVDWQAP